MADKYNQSWVCSIGLWRFKNYAITIGQTTYYSCGKEMVTTTWRIHENKHKEQWKKDGFIKFGIKYIYLIITRGYINNPYEIEARESAIIK